MPDRDMHDWRYIVTVSNNTFWQCNKCMLIATSTPEGEVYTPQVEKPCLYA